MAYTKVHEQWFDYPSPDAQIIKGADLNHIEQGIVDAHNLATNVVGNPSDSASKTLEKLKIDDETYSIPKNDSYSNLNNLPQINGVTLTGNKTSADLKISGGTNVVANPSGSATSTLTKLTVGSTIYSIPDGSSSSSGITETLITPTKYSSYGATGSTTTNNALVKNVKSIKFDSSSISNYKLIALNLIAVDDSGDFDPDRNLYGEMVIPLEYILRYKVIIPYISISNPQSSPIKMSGHIVLVNVGTCTFNIYKVGDATEFDIGLEVYGYK